MLDPILPKDKDQTMVPLDSGDNTIKNLLYFSQPLSKIPLKVMFCTLATLIKESLMVAFSTLGSQVMSSSGFIFLNMTDDLKGQSYLGIAFSFNLIFFYGFFLSLVDKLGIDISINYGSGDYEKTKKSLNQGIYTALFVFTCLTIPCFVFGKYLLIITGIDEDQANGCQEILYWMLIPNSLEIMLDLIRNYCMALGNEFIFGPTSLVAIIISVGCGYLFIVELKQGVFGWVLSRIIYEGLCLLVALWVMFTKTPPGTRGLLPFSKVKKGFLGFFCQSLKYAIGSYSEFLGYEIASLFVYRSNDEIQIAAYSAVLNISSIVYSSGESFAVICRTRMNLLIGKNLKQTSKNFFMFYIIGTLLFGVGLSAVFYLLRPYLVSAFASSDKNLSKLFDSLLQIYSIVFPFELTLTTAFMGIKTIGSINYLLFLNLFLLIGVNTGTCYYWSIYLNKDAITIYANLITIFISVNLLCIIKVACTDWSKRELDYDPVEANIPLALTNSVLRIKRGTSLVKEEKAGIKSIERLTDGSRFEKVVSKEPEATITNSKINQEDPSQGGIASNGKSTEV